MKNTKRKLTAKINTTKFEALRKLKTFGEIKRASKQFLATFFIYALVVVPLLTTDLAVRQAHAQSQPTGTTGITVVSGTQTISGNLVISGNLLFPPEPPPPVTYLTFGQTALSYSDQSRNDPDEVVQLCLLGCGEVEEAIKNQALDDVIKTYGLPDTAAERLRVKRYARAEYRAALFTRLLAFFRKPNPTADEQAAIDVFIRRFKAKRVQAATEAINEYQKWTQTVCRGGYTPPSPYTYNVGTGCFGGALNFSGPNPPSFEEFVQFGATKVYSEIFTAENQKLTADTAAAMGVGVGIGAAIVGAGVGAAVGSTLTFGTLSAILPFAGTVWVPTTVPVLTLVSGGVGAVETGEFIFVATAPAASAASGGIGASAAAGPVGIIIIALSTGIVAGIQFHSKAELPGKLQEALDKARNDTYNQFNFNTDEAAIREIYATYFTTTLPDFNHAGDPVPPVSNDDGKFNQTDLASGNITLAPTFNYVDWDGKCHSARLSGGWFVDKNLSTNVEKQVLSINYIGTDGKPMVAARKGTQFVLTDPHDVTHGKAFDGIDYRDCAGKSVHTEIELTQLEIVPQPRLVVNCPGSSTVIIGKLRGSNINPADLRVTLNGAASTTVNGVTLSNASITQANRISAQLQIAPNAPIPASGEVNITVSKINSGVTASSKFTLERTAIQDFFRGDVNVAVRVGDNFGQQYEQYTSPLPNVCFDSTTTVVGEIPAGLTLTNTPGNIVLSGTLTSGGKYVFALQKTYTNGEILKRIYTINVKSELTAVPSGLVSWWRAENNYDDFTGAHDGTLGGRLAVAPSGQLGGAESYSNFADGKVGRGFKFDGEDGYVKLPGDTFDSSRAYTFETWFKTSKSGTILGQQNNGNTPYGTSDGASQMIYVDRAGNLYVNLFNPSQGEKVVANNVNDNRSHHLAVRHFVAPNGQMQNEVFLDGVFKAIYDDYPQPVSNPVYQFGTGYHRQKSANDDASGWSNFSGIVDEPALYNRYLTGDEIKSIFTSGAAGKIAVEVVASPTLDTTGSIRINVRGGERGLTYSIDNGATFKNTSEFSDLAPKSYNIVVKDGAGRIYRTTAAVPYASPGLNVTAQGTNPKCSGATNGTITIDPGIFAVSGTGTTNVQNIPLLYSLNGGATTQSSNVFTNLAPGNYTPWVKHEPSNTVAAGARVTLINPPPLALNPTNFVNSAAVGFSYNQEFQVVNGTAPINVTVSQSPPGLIAYTNDESRRGAFAIRGAPTQTGTFTMTVTATDGNSCPLTQTITLTVYDNNCRVVTVQNNNDGGAGSLRQTIADACPEARVRIPSSIGQITLNSQITIDKSLNIEADNPNLNVISGNNVTRIFETAVGATINISNVTLTGGNAGQAAAGAIANRGTLGISNSVLVNNRALSGGAIYNIGAVYLQNTSVLNNFASGNSGGIFNGGGNTVELRNVTIAGNSTNGTSGGIDNNGTLFAANATITGNRSNVDGVTDGNGTDGGGLSANGTETFVNTIVAGNYKGTANSQAASDVNGAIESAVYSLFGDAGSAGGVTNGGANQNIVGNNGSGTISIASILSPNLSLNGGSTPNFALAANSPAIDKGKAYNDFTRFGNSDQRFQTRPVDNPDVPNATGGNGSDIGSFEAQSTAANPSAMSISGRITNGGQGLSNVLVVLSNSKSATTYTDAAGNYSFGDLPSGGYFNVTPTLNGYAFTSPALAYSNVSTSITGADFVTTTTTYEGDIAGRPTGNGTIDIFDLVTLGRIIGTLDPKPANGGEFQRADVAPFSTLGDGAINVQDLVQMGSYVGNLSPKTPASGAAAPAAQTSAAQSSALSFEKMSSVTAESLLSQNLFDNAQSDKSTGAAQSAAGMATLGAGSVTATSTNAVVPLSLNSTGDTAAIQFTVNYDTAKLSIPMNPTNTAIINRYPNTTFIINNNTPGKLGIVAYQPLDGASAFPSNTIKLFDINFTVVSGASGTTTVSFGNDPIPQTASNPQAGAVQVSTTPGTVTFLAPTAASVSLSGRVMIGTRGLINATVYLTAQNGETRAARTGAFGFYHFNDVAAGETYIISVVSKKYSFAPQAINVTEDMDNLNFTASLKDKTETLSP